MVNLTINNQQVRVEEGTTIIEAARQNHISIPNLCYMEGIHKLGACRICVVEVEGARALQASCLTPVQEGMVVHTNTARLRHARKVLYELMLSDHAQDCLSCTRSLNCEFQALGRQLGVDTSRFQGERSPYHLDVSTSITRDMSKCVLCRRCVTVCNEIQGACVLAPQNRGFGTEIAPAMELPIGSVDCSFCGQCTVVCPVGALKETSSVQKVWDALGDPAKRCVVQVAPAVRVALGEEFGYPAGSRVTGKMAAALRRMGFDDIFDTNFAADLTIMEEGTELLQRLTSALAGGNATLPMMTSCSPGWIKYVEHHYPDHLEHLSSCKSPHTMLGAMIKSYYAEKTGTPAEDLFVVSIMPCTAKKTEIAREEMQNDGLPNVDAVLTTRELAEMIHSAGIDFGHLTDEDFDRPLGLSTGAADIFGLTGGVMEAALRTAYELVTGRELPFDGLHVAPIMGLEQVKEASILIESPLPAYAALDGVELKVAVTSGLKGARQLMEQIAAGDSPYHFIEVMGCPGGCIMGGGQPRSADPDVATKRMKGLYAEDESKVLRKSHENPDIQALYQQYLGQPGGHRSHELLHTHYVERGLYNERTEEDFVEYSSLFVPGADAPPAPIPATPAESLRMRELEKENHSLKEELAELKEKTQTATV